MADDSGVWVKIVPDDFNLSGGNASSAVIATANGANNQIAYKPADFTDNADGSYDYVEGDVTYRVYAFDTPSTTSFVSLTDEAKLRIEDEYVITAISLLNDLPNFDGDPLDFFDGQYRDQLKDSLIVSPAVDPGLSFTVGSAGYADVLCIGGGGSGASGGGSGSSGGGSGGAKQVRMLLEEREYTMTIGKGGAIATTGNRGGNPGKDTFFDGERFAKGVQGTQNTGSAGGGGWSGNAWWANGGGGGATSQGGVGYTGGCCCPGGSGLISSITGVEVEYAQGGRGNSKGASPDTPGSGGAGGYDSWGDSMGTGGFDGLVIVRVEI